MVSNCRVSANEVSVAKGNEVSGDLSSRKSTQLIQKVQEGKNRVAASLVIFLYHIKLLFISNGPNYQAHKLDSLYRYLFLKKKS